LVPAWQGPTRKKARLIPDFDDRPPQRLMFRKAFVSDFQKADFFYEGLLL